jgi:hypothetical protein
MVIRKIIIRLHLLPSTLFVIPSEDEESLDASGRAGEPSGYGCSSNRTRHAYRKGRE